MDFLLHQAYAAPYPAPSPAAAIDALYAVGHWLLGQNRVIDAACVLRGMLVAKPDDERAWLALGVCHERLEQPRVAAEIYKAAGAACDRPPRVALALAAVLDQLGECHDARDARRNAAEWAIEKADVEVMDRLRAGGYLS